MEADIFIISSWNPVLFQLIIIAVQILEAFSWGQVDSHSNLVTWPCGCRSLST